MTTSTLLGVLLRRWYMVAFGLALGLAALGAIRSSEPVFWTEADVTFLAPEREPAYWISGGSAMTLAAFADMVKRRVDQEAPSVDLALTRGTLYGAGVQQGFSVTLPANGGQWNKTFSQPVLKVQVVDTSAERVNQVLAVVVERINVATIELQDEASVKADHISTQTTPSQAEVVFGGGTPVTRMKGAVVWAGLSLAVTSAGVLYCDRVLVRRRHNRSDPVEETSNASRL
ncbi:hypothetical protein [Arthrobacter sp. ISL-95]|uniref:hypothetical protein n=1 Tax=Arthrobacter sp. ISL-95 TaxID=2819116 RepID=UPI001BEA8F3B|nr:hypothetical protein [Arthrobacter sp. ISL-95]MBT2587293.1 hypothetical protein [Arthrobacter sp. ISL-95]